MPGANSYLTIGPLESSVWVGTGEQWVFAAILLAGVAGFGVIGVLAWFGVP